MFDFPSFSKTAAHLAVPCSVALQQGDCGPGDKTLLVLRTVLESLTSAQQLGGAPISLKVAFVDDVTHLLIGILSTIYCYECVALQESASLNLL